jgi:hypothetical protein
MADRNQNVEKFICSTKYNRSLQIIKKISQSLKTKFVFVNLKTNKLGTWPGREILFLNFGPPAEKVGHPCSTTL